MALATGTRLGPYEIVAALGAGGMGEVYQARDTRLDRTVAIKVLPPELSADPERRARFEREARTIAALNHPHICTLHDIGQHDGTTYLVMEHLVGETLAQRLRKGPLPIAQALDIGAQIAEALDAAHKAGIVHRDLKPSNVMLTTGAAGRSGTGAVKLLDFGLAKLRESGAAPVGVDVSAPTATEPLTRAGEVLGTRPYMAPEQVEGKATDARTDLWALGCVLYEMVTGRAAFTGDSVASITAAILDREPEPLTTWQPLTPKTLERVVGKCLAKRPDDRWDSAHDVADELRWIAQAGQGAGAFRTGWPALREKRRWILVSAGALVSLVVGGTALWLWASRVQESRHPTVEPAATASAAPLVVAVLPFRNVAGDAQFAYLADGATEALTNGLARVPRLGGVVASASARRVTGAEGDARTAAERLGADRVIEGTSFGDGTRVRFEARLSDRDGRVIWSDRVDGDAPAILDVYDTLLVRVSGALGEDLPLEQRRRAQAIDLEAHRQLVTALLSRDRGRVVDGARQALALSPNYAEAHRVLADYLSTDVYLGRVEGSSAAVLREAREHAERAVELDPANGLAFKTGAAVRFIGGDREGAEADYRQALALAPGSAEVHASWSWYLSHFNRFDECLAAGERAAALDPLTPSTASGWCLFEAGRYAEAAAKLQANVVGRGGRRFPFLAAAYARAGQVEKARALRDEWRKTTQAGQDPVSDWWIIYVHLAEGDRAGARRIADLWWNKADKSATEWILVSQMFGALDDVDRTVECLLRAGEKCGNPDPCYTGWDVLPESVYSERVRRDPRLLDLAAKARQRREGT